MKKITILPPAEQEMIEIARFYETQAKGLGLEFLSEVRSAVDNLAQNPEASPNLKALPNPDAPPPPDAQFSPDAPLPHDAPVPHDAPPPHDTHFSSENGIQRRLIRRFPCGILYVVEPDQIVIIAIMHLRRNPWAH